MSESTLSTSPNASSANLPGAAHTVTTQKKDGSLNRLAGILILVVFFFAILMQRVMLSKETAELRHPGAAKQMSYLRTSFQGFRNKTTLGLSREISEMFDALHARENLASLESLLKGEIATGIDTTHSQDTPTHKVGEIHGQKPHNNMLTKLEHPMKQPVSKDTVPSSSGSSSSSISSPSVPQQNNIKHDTFAQGKSLSGTATPDSSILQTETMKEGKSVNTETLLQQQKLQKLKPRHVDIRTGLKKQQQHVDVEAASNKQANGGNQLTTMPGEKQRRPRKKQQQILSGIDASSQPQPQLSSASSTPSLKGKSSTDSMSSNTGNMNQASKANSIAVTTTSSNSESMYPSPDYYYRSPRKGTDISPSQQMQLLRCQNQSRCITPELQLQPVFKIYFCKRPVNHGIRFYFLVREGLLLHPNVQLVAEEDINSADFIIYLPGSAPWHRTECTNLSYVPRLIVLDEFDGYNAFEPQPTQADMVRVYGKSMQWYYMYFKRSFVARRDGHFLDHPHLDKPDFYPLTYAIAEAYTQHSFTFNRQIEILCTLRGSKHMTTRLRVQTWVTEYAKNRSVANAITSEVNTASRQTVSNHYFTQMYNSEIIVTVNPANWEGDFRLWEAMATGALVMVDPIFVPHSYPLLDGVQVVYFSNKNKTELWDRLDYYRTHKEEARRIAINGYLHAMKYHRTVNLIDYVLRSAHLKREMLLHHKPLPKYKYTAQYLHKETINQRKGIISSQKPGKYHLPE